MDITYKYSEGSCNVRKVNISGKILIFDYIYILPKTS